MKIIFSKNYIIKTISSNKFLELLLKEAKTQKLYDVFLQGKLKKTKDNFVYLDIPNELMDGLFKLLDDKVNKPPYNKEKFNNIGAHVSVIKKDEFDNNNLKNIKEIEEEFSFQLGKVMSVNPDGWDEMKKVWFLSIISPELEKFRKKYNLTPKIDNHDFHITFGVQKQ